MDKMRRASMAAYLAEAQGVKSLDSDGSTGSSPSASFKEREGITRKEAWSNMVLALIGVMVCLLPNIMSKSGYLLAPLLLLLASLVVIRMGKLICEACELVEETRGSAPGSVKSNEDLAKAVGMYKILLVSKNTVILATVLVAEKFLIDALSGLLPKPMKLSKSVLRWFFIFPAVCLMALLKDLTQLSKYAWVGLVGMTVQLFGLVGGCLLGCFTERDRSYSMLPPEGSTIPGMAGITLSAFIFAFAILATVPSVRAQMQKPQEMPQALRDAIGFTVILYEVIMLWGYFAYGEDVSENFTQDIAAAFPVFGMLPSLGLLANVAITAPLFFYCFFSVIEATGTDAIRTQGTRPNTVARVSLVLVLTLFGWIIPGILSLIGVFSSVFCVCNNLFFPIFFYHRLRRQTEHPVSALDLGLNVATAFLGVLVFVYGLQGSLETLWKEMGSVGKPTKDTIDAVNKTLSR